MVLITIMLERIEDFPETEMNLFSLEFERELDFEIKFLNNNKVYRYKTVPYQGKYLISTK